jgi:hypothetical protein
MRSRHSAQAQAAARREGADAPNLGAISDELASLATDVEGADRAPTAAQEHVLTTAANELAAARIRCVEGDSRENELVRTQPRTCSGLRISRKSMFRLPMKSALSVSRSEGKGFALSPQGRLNCSYSAKTAITGGHEEPALTMTCRGDPSRRPAKLPPLKWGLKADDQTDRRDHPEGLLACAPR